MKVTSDEAIAHVKARTDTVILSFSRGKDSLAAWVVLNQHFKIIPVYLECPPGIDFIDESLRYYEAFFETAIERHPHPMFLNLIRGWVYQPPSRVNAIHELRRRYRKTEIADVLEEVQRQHRGAYVAYSMSINDSIVRRALIGRAGAVDDKKRKFYVHHDKKKTEIIEIIKTSGVKLPVDYRYHERSVNGINFRAVSWIKDVFPADYERIKFWFPLIDLEIKRMEFREKYLTPKAKPPISTP